MHMQFLEEFYRQILPGIEADALEYLNNITIRMYEAKGIDAETDLSGLTPGDYPTLTICMRRYSMIFRCPPGITARRI